MFQGKDTFEVKTTAGLYPLMDVETGRVNALAHGGVLLTETVRACGLDVLLSQALAPWSKPLARHDPAKVVLDLALSLAVGGDCLAEPTSRSCAPSRRCSGPWRRRRRLVVCWPP